MELRQLTLNAHLGSINICAYTFLFVDQSSPRGLEKFREDIPTSPEVIEAHALNFKPNFECSRLQFFGGTPVPVGVCASKPGSIPNACKNLKGSTPIGRNVVSRKMSNWVGQYEPIELFCLRT